ncbi:hypothetical protein L0P85_07065 [Terrisporobacter glycolicus]|uniref:hypothetical protein n=1 Tax=Terrisporobacter petrolearius TaxID=1460447 RepID=UPI001F477300|nr:hypothetical protein L0P85_07065 [Terrisporobacter glycolicus]
MDLKQLKEDLYTNDVSFQYNDKDYVINPLDKFYAGEAGNSEDDNEFDTFEDMAENWIIEGKKLKDIVKFIKLI